MEQKDMRAGDDSWATDEAAEEEEVAGAAEQVDLEDVESLRQALSAEKARAEDYLDSWKRAKADFINFKRRSERERGDTVRLANASLMLTLLPVLDDLERALGNVSEKLLGFTWVDGIELIYRKLRATLESQGLSEIEALGQTFDPNVHEAVLYGEGEEHKVTEVLQKGYKLHERVLRPAMVKVGKGPEGAAGMDSEEALEENSQEEGEEENNG